MKPVYNPYFAGFFMAAIAGFSDVFGFIALDRLFTAHITGNIVIIISYLIYGTIGIIPKLLAIPLFILFAAIISTIIEHHSHTKRALLLWISLEILFFVLLLLIGRTMIPEIEITSWAYTMIAMLPICAMAIHNTLLRTYMSTIPPCTVMTGNLTQFIIDLTALCFNKVPEKSTLRENLLLSIKSFGNVLCGFVVGGLLSTFGYIFLGFYSLIFIIFLLLILLIHLKTFEVQTT